MRLPRLTTRRLMALVAVVGLFLAIAVRRQRLLDLASYHSDRAIQTRMIQAGGVRVKPGDVVVLPPGAIAYSTPRSDWHTRMFVEYRQAARYPWIFVPPDPPPPD